MFWITLWSSWALDQWRFILRPNLTPTCSFTQQKIADHAQNDFIPVFYTSSELFFQCWDEHAFTANGTKHQEAETSLISHSLFPLTVAMAVGELAVCSWVYTLIRLLQPVRSDACRAHLSSSVAFGSLSDLPAVGNNMSACLVVANRRTPQLASRCPLIDRRRCKM